jgi:hypothetical protein
MRSGRAATHVVSCGVILLVACAKSEKPADTTSTAVVPAATSTPSTSAGTVAPAPIALADVAGTWNVRATPQGGTDTTVTQYVLTATGTPDGWKIKYANGLVVPVKVTVAGDSIIMDAGPYKSVRRKGVQVTTHGALRKEGDKLVGTTIAHYNVKTADSVLTLHSEGTKAP